MNIFRALIFVGIGSGIGGMLRYLVTRLLQNSFVTLFPLGTLAVNVLGCLLLGLLYGLFERGNLMNAELRLLLTVGICGGFTTFSTFINENYSFLQNGNFLMSALYAALSLVLGMAAIYGGNYIIKLI